jgi:hypothetical protein
MTVYAPSDVRSINIPHGCPESHEAGELAEGERFSVDCAVCEPLIMATKTGWAHTPEGVHLTPDERAVVEFERKEAERIKAKTWGDPDALGSSLGRSLADALKAASPAQVDQALIAQADENKALMASMMEKIEELTAKLAEATSKADEAPAGAVAEEAPAPAKKAAKKAAPTAEK